MPDRWNGVEWREPLQVLHLRIEFDSGKDWEYQLLLHGRTPLAFYVDDMRCELQPVIKQIDMHEPREVVVTFDRNGVIRVSADGQRLVKPPFRDYDVIEGD